MIHPIEPAYIAHAHVWAISGLMDGVTMVSKIRLCMGPASEFSLIKDDLATATAEYLTCH